MSNLLIKKRRRDYQYFLCTGLVLGLSTPKSEWSKTRSQTWWNDIVGNFNDEQWKENFRMTRDTFYALCEELRPFFPGSVAPVRKPIDLHHKVAIALYWLASVAEYRTIGNLFGVGTATVWRCVHTVCTGISENLLHRYVTLPTGEELQNVINGFEQHWGFPNCGGAIDGTHIPIIAPVEAHGDYLNRKGWYSVILQATCNYKYIITDINVGWPGRVHDARVFANSELYHKGETKDLFPNWLKNIKSQDNDATMPVVLLGDAAYPLKSWLLKPYTRLHNLTASERLFNYKLSRGRMTIENTFGRLKGRWRRIQKRLDVEVEFACTVITACVVLHNLCEMRQENPYDLQIECEDDTNDADGCDNDDDPLLCSKRLRNNLAAYFVNA